MNPTSVAVLALALVLAHTARGQAPPVMPANLAAGLLARFDESAIKLEELAESIPAERYSWRPRAGVRSVSEVLVHVAMGNYYTAEDAGVKGPGKLPKDAEHAVTEKSQVVAFLKRANSHIRTALQSLTVEALGKPTTMFDQRTTYGNVYLFGVGHVHEHLGQLVAYARMIGVTPPWSVGH